MDTDLKPYKQASLIRLYLDKEFGVNHPMDIILRTPETIEKRVELGDFFIREIISKGISL